MNNVKEITKGQFITWIISAVIFISGVFLTTYIDVETRVRNLEIEIREIQTKQNIRDRDMNALLNDTKEIKELIHQMNVKLSIDEERHGNKAKKAVIR